MADETVTITAALKDEMSAPLDQVVKKVDGFTKAVVDGSKKQGAAADKATAQITGAVDSQKKTYGGLTGVFSRVGGAGSRMFSGLTSAARTGTSTTSRLFSNMRASALKELERIEREAKESGKKAGSGFGEGMKGMIGPALAGLSLAGVGALANSAVASFSELEDSSAAAGVVFGKNMDDIIAQSMTGAEKLGLSQQAVINGANTFGTYGKAAGLAGKDLSGFATGLTGLAGDMASFKGTTTEQALEAIAAGLRGEAEPLRAYGVMLDDVQMRDEALRMGLIKTTKDALTPQQKVLAAQSLIFKQTKDAQGDFARTSDSTANTAKRLSAASENLSAKVGSLLAPAFTAVRTKLLAAVGSMSKFVDGAQGLYDLLVKGDFTGTFRDAFNVEEDSKLVDTLFKIREGAIGLHDLLVNGNYSGLLRSAFGWEEDSKAVDMLLSLRDAAIEIPGKLEAVAKTLWDMRTPIGIIAGLIITLFIPHWIALGVEALKSAAKQKIAWMVARTEATKAALAHSAAVTKMIGGWVLMAATAMINAAKIAASWLVAMGPIGWAILAIAGLVAMFVWAYNNVEWFRDGVDAAMRWIGEAVQNVGKWFSEVWTGIVDWWNTTLMPAIQSVGQWFSDVFTNIGNWLRDFVGFFVDGWGMMVDFYNGVLAPIIKGIGDVFAFVFDWISRLVWNATTIIVFLFQKLVSFWNTVLLPALTNLGNFFGTILNWIYTTIIKPVVDFIVGLFRSLVDFWNLTLVPALQAVGTWFGTILNWIYTTIVQPVIDFIVAAFRGIVDFWNLTLMPAFQAVGDFIGTTMNWIYNTLIKPIVDFIVSAFQGLVDFWNGTLQPVIDTVAGWFEDTIGGAISGVGDFIDNLKKGFDLFIKFWTDTLKPVVDAIATAFNFVKDAIDGALSSIGDFAKNPLGGVQDLLGIEKDENGQGKMPSNSGGGVYKGNGVAFAGGGVLGGYAPGRDSILARLSPGESVLVPELTRAIGPQNIMAANAAASGGRPAGSGPALTSGYSQPRSGAAAGSTVVVNAPVTITVNAPNGVTGVELDQIRAAVEEVFAAENRRRY